MEERERREEEGKKGKRARDTISELNFSNSSTTNSSIPNPKSGYTLFAQWCVEYSMASMCRSSQRHKRHVTKESNKEDDERKKK